MMHSSEERMHSLNIEYIHINACMAYIQDIFIEALMSHPKLPLHQKIALVRALNKVLMIQLDLFAKWRVRDGEEYADEMPTFSFGSREGYVGDKRILGGSDGSSVDDDRASIAESLTPSVTSTAASMNTMYTAQSNTTINRAQSQRSACPFAMMRKGAGSETTIWAN